MDNFNLKSLEQLPNLAELQDLEKAGEQLEMQLQTNFNFNMPQFTADEKIVYETA